MKRKTRTISGRLHGLPILKGKVQEVLKVTITPKVPIPGSFFLDHENALVFKTNAVSMTNGHLLFWDNERDSAVNHKFDMVNNFYDIVTER